MTPKDRAVGAAETDVAGRRRAVAAERWLAGAILAGIGVCAISLLRSGYLPQPFYYRPAESFFDFYSVALYANNDRGFDVWHSLYPPLSFVLLKLITVKSCYAGGLAAGRACDGLSKVVMGGVFFANFVVAFLSYRRVDPATAAPRAVAMGLGLPMLYALERGNLLIPCFTAFALGYGNLLPKGWPRQLALAVSMNFKPYLGLVALPFVIQRRWAWAAGTAAFCAGLYLATLALYGSGSPAELIRNEAGYAVAASKSYFADLYFATSYWPLIRLLHARPPGLQLLPAGLADAAGLGLTILLRVLQIAGLSCLVLGLWRPKRVDARRMGALVAVLSITAFTTGSAGYAQLFFIFLVFFEPWRGPGRATLLAVTYLLCLPLDLVILPVVHETARSFLTGRAVMTDFGVSLGQIVRPGLLLVAQGVLVWLNAGDLLRRGRVPSP